MQNQNFRSETEAGSEKRYYKVNGYGMRMTDIFKLFFEIFSGFVFLYSGYAVFLCARAGGVRALSLKRISKNR